VATVVGAIGLAIEPAATPTVTPPPTDAPTTGSTETPTPEPVTSPPTPEPPTDSPTPIPEPAWAPSTEQKTAVVNYLVGHFNDSIGLIYESEDTGTRITLNGISYRCNQSFFIYSDNLLAEYALKTSEPQISHRINQTIQSYGLPSGDFFEVLFGQIISEPLCNGKTVNITNDANRIILAEFRDYSSPIKGQYANALIYRSLNNYLKGDMNASKGNFTQVLNLWDGKGINDDATKQDNSYANYKLALVVYASKVLSINDPRIIEIEQKLWSMQQPNGGITSLADLAGNPLGSTNAETTSMTLIAYNNQLIAEMQALYGIGH